MPEHLAEREERLGHRDVAPQGLSQLIGAARALGDQAGQLVRAAAVKREALVDQRSVVGDRVAVTG